MFFLNDVLMKDIFVLFTIILIGYLGKKSKALPEESSEVIVKLILNITLPLLIIVSLNLPYEKVLAVAMLQTAIVAIIATLFLIIFSHVAVKLLKLRSEDQRVWRFMVIFGNVTFIGYPICYSILGQEGIFLAAVFDLVQTIFMFTYGIFLLAGKKDAFKKLDFSFLKDPVIGALIIGVILFLANIELPKFMHEVFLKVGSTTTVLSMLTIGLIIQFRSLKGKNIVVSHIVLVIVKLIIIPLAFFYLSSLLPLIKIARVVSFIMLATPSGILSTVLSYKHCGEGQFAAQGVFLTHLFCIITLPIMIYLIQI